MFVCNTATPKAEIEGARSQAESVVYNTKKYQDDLQKLGLRIKQHEDIIKFLRTEKNSIDESILNLQVTIGKYHASMQPVTEEEEAQSKVDDENLSRLLAEYLGKNNMLALVCKTFHGVQAMESCDREGAINRDSGLHGLGSSVGRTIEGRFLIICLNDLRPYVGKFIADDPQRRLDLLKPKLAASGHGLRETLFYYLFSRLQVYRTREDMMQALPFIADGALSLDGGIIRSPGVFHLGNREEPEVKFPRISEKSSLPGNYYEIENSLQSKRWNLERLLEDMRKEQSMLDQAKFNFEIKKQEFVRFLAQSSHYAPPQQQQQQPQQSPAGQESLTPKPKSSCPQFPVII
ncbi:hypothetical protein POM88_036089 [Heracleum sosnowskyi]|uniref:Protein DEFECTIVE IN MERISTEM SILENCING 3 n=1 Tax=Heracleum sosnowskyi TaxID=360622 RepID=A0AAD8HMH5_9APIA|nr:hypothetical protein POM88_036089 [Heracleum sosnowskyi]